MEVTPNFGTLLIGNNTSLPVKTPVHQAVYTCSITLYIINLVLFLISFTFGTVSWVLIPQWRRFQNYVFMNLVVASTINMIGFNLCAHHKYPDIVVVLLLLAPRIVMSHWLLVTTVMFYTDIVKVFNIDVSRKYLKAGIFSWIVPFVEVLPFYIIDHYLKIGIFVKFNYGINIVLLLTTFILYFIVVYFIIKSMLTNNRTRKEICRRVLTASAAGIASGVSTLLPILISEVMHSELVTYNIAIIMCLLTITAGHVAFLSLKGHKAIWGEYRRRRQTINNF